MNLQEIIGKKGYILTVFEARYGGGFNAICGYTSDAARDAECAFTGGDDMGCAAGGYWCNPAYPGVEGANTVAEAIEKLDQKLRAWPTTGELESERHDLEADVMEEFRTRGQGYPWNVSDEMRRRIDDWDARCKAAKAGAAQ